jgi:hypothetical protein
MFPMESPRNATTPDTSLDGNDPLIAEDADGTGSRRGPTCRLDPDTPSLCLTEAGRGRVLAGKWGL